MWVRKELFINCSHYKCGSLSFFTQGAFWINHTSQIGRPLVTYLWGLMSDSCTHMAESVATLCNAWVRLGRGRRCTSPLAASAGEAGRKRVRRPTLQGQCPGIEASQLGQNRSAGGFEDQLTRADRVTGDARCVRDVRQVHYGRGGPFIAGRKVLSHSA